jgi:hypothetical protein
MVIWEKGRIQKVFGSIRKRWGDRGIGGWGDRKIKADG